MTELPRTQHGRVLAGVKATPDGWPPASLDPGSGRDPTAAAGSVGRGTRIKQIQVSTLSGDCQLSPPASIDPTTVSAFAPL